MVYQVQNFVGGIKKGKLGEGESHDSPIWLVKTKNSRLWEQLQNGIAVIN